MLFLHIEHETNFILGCTIKELAMIVGLSFLMGLTLGFVFLNVALSIPTSRTFILSILCGFLLGALFTAILAKILKSAKHNKPPYMYKQKLRLWAQKMSLIKPQICVRSGYWSA